MDAHVWIGTKGRFNPFQQFEEGTLTLDGSALVFRGAGEPVLMHLSEVEFRFPLSMTGTGFVLTVRGVKAYVYFMDPAASRKAVLESGDVDDGGVAGATSFFEGRRAGKPFLKALRAVAH